MPRILFTPPDRPSATRPRPRTPHQCRRVGDRPSAASLFDRLAAGVCLVLVGPLIGLLWLLVRITSRGPGIFSQRRSGLHGREFQIYKLRTMTHDCERRSGAVWAQRHDPRVTPLGRFLRATHLDELPQLINVVRGEMALVGPRPERPEIIERLLPEVPGYLDRLEVPPGVTGLAQVCASADFTVEDTRRKLGYDLAYIQAANRSLDLRILLVTGLKVIGLNRPALRRWLFSEISPVIERTMQHAEV